MDLSTIIPQTGSLVSDVGSIMALFPSPHPPIHCRYSAKDDGARARAAPLWGMNLPSSGSERSDRFRATDAPNSTSSFVGANDAG